MNLAPREKGDSGSPSRLVARLNREQIVHLKHPETMALIPDFMAEVARDIRLVVDLILVEARVQARLKVMGGVPEMIQ